MSWFRHLTCSSVSATCLCYACLLSATLHVLRHLSTWQGDAGQLLCVDSDTLHILWYLPSVRAMHVNFQLLYTFCVICPPGRVMQVSCCVLIQTDTLHVLWYLPAVRAMHVNYQLPYTFCIICAPGIIMQVSCWPPFMPTWWLSVTLHMPYPPSSPPPGQGYGKTVRVSCQPSYTFCSICPPGDSVSLHGHSVSPPGRARQVSCLCWFFFFLKRGVCNKTKQKTLLLKYVCTLEHFFCILKMLAKSQLIS